MSTALDQPTGIPRSRRIAKRLRGLLAEEQVPALRVAEALGVTQSYLARRMTGSVALSVDEPDAISAALGVRFEWLTTGEGAKSRGGRRAGELQQQVRE